MLPVQCRTAYHLQPCRAPDALPAMPCSITCMDAKAEPTCSLCKVNSPATGRTHLQSLQWQLQRQLSHAALRAARGTGHRQAPLACCRCGPLCRMPRVMGSRKSIRAP